MYVIKMKTLICYLAVSVFFACAAGILHFCEVRDTEAAAAVEIETDLSSADAESTDFRAKNSASAADKKTAAELPILMYHSMCKSNGKTGRYIISETDFENDLKYLCDNGYTTVVTEDLTDYVSGVGTLPEKPVMLTFDDGYYNNYVYAYPLLKKYDARAVLSIIGYYTDLYTETPDQNPAYSHLTWDNIRELMDSGRFEFQNHSYNLHTTDKGRNGSKKKSNESSEAYRSLLTADLGKLQQEFKNNTDYTPTAYTYPFGSVSNASFSVIKEMGFRASFSCESGMNRITRDPECLYMLKRYLRTPEKSAADILKQ